MVLYKDKFEYKIDGILEKVYFSLMIFLPRSAYITAYSISLKEYILQAIRNDILIQFISFDKMIFTTYIFKNSSIFPHTFTHFNLPHAFTLTYQSTISRLNMQAFLIVIIIIIKNRTEKGERTLKKHVSK